MSFEVLQNVMKETFFTCKKIRGKSRGELGIAKYLMRSLSVTLVFFFAIYHAK